ncbi:class I SAM-dependent methyltransferase [Chitinophaga sp. G-6-1-13]|uniref:Class I SAM-dependent methyltransferase n=1 Tax=Chitinophaga fulva TaxID=2728842 RepID=A0A848GJW0_9BACT|nr:class I SAM-dependent methyltransferase [Chitinophaga fulva]NML37312.1 class I SAM-dependent methyltransferase [Chitinophaga fulva]
MINLIQTAERTNNSSHINNYIFQRHLFAYKSVPEKWLSGKDVLEIGCGTAYGASILAADANVYVGLDKKVPVVEPAFKNTRFLKCTLPFLQEIPDGSFDTIVCFQVIEHIRQDALLLSEMKRVLKKDGVILITTPNRLTTLVRNPFHVREYTGEELGHLVHQYFDKFDIYGVFGNERVKEYYEVNKKAVAGILRIDRWGLIDKMPAALLKIPYSIMNNLNRLLLFLSAPPETRMITDEDFSLLKVDDDCLDLFAVIHNSDQAEKLRD